MESAPGPDDGSQSQTTESQDGTESPGACGPGPESTSLGSAPEGALQVDSEVHNPAGRDDEVQQRVSRAMEVVRRRTNWAIAGGLLPIPGFDILAIAGVQLAMLRELSVHYGVPFQRNLAKSLTTTLLGSVLPYTVGAGLAGSIAKVMPVLGWGVGLAAVSALAGAATHATGLVFVQHFESGGTFLDFDPVATREFFRREFDAARNRGGSSSAGSA